MTEPTYTIKPPVWEGSDETGWRASGMLDARLKVWYHTWTGWAWTIELGNLDDTLDAGGKLADAKAAKLAAESAYRKLLMEHLNAV